MKKKGYGNRQKYREEERKEEKAGMCGKEDLKSEEVIRKEGREEGE